MIECIAVELGGFLGAVLRYLIGLILLKEEFDRMAYDWLRKTANFWLEDTCIGCGLCAKQSLVHAIQM